MVSDLATSGLEGDSVVSETERTDRVFHALADATRRDIFRQAMHETQSVSSLARRYPMSIAAVQKHVTVLERAELITKERQGREQLVRCNIDTIRWASRLLDHFEQEWRARIDRFGEVLAEPDTQSDTQSDTQQGASS